MLLNTFTVSSSLRHALLTAAGRGQSKGYVALNANLVLMSPLLSLAWSLNDSLEADALGSADLGHNPWRVPLADPSYTLEDTYSHPYKQNTWSHYSVTLSWVPLSISPCCILSKTLSARRLASTYIMNSV